MEPPVSRGPLVEGAQDAGGGRVHLAGARSGRRQHHPGGGALGDETATTVTADQGTSDRGYGGCEVMSTIREGMRTMAAVRGPSATRGALLPTMRRAAGGLFGIWLVFTCG